MKPISALMSILPVLCILLPLAATRAQEGDESLINNGGLEADTDGDGMADDWQFSGDSGVTVKWSREPGIEGDFCQKLECTAFRHLSAASHVMLAQYNAFALEEGQWYRLTFQVRGEGIEGSAADVNITNRSITNTIRFIPPP